jgi:hypothetical protein
MIKGESSAKPPCLHQKAVFRARTIPESQLRDVKAGWMSHEKLSMRSGVILAATVEAPVMGSDGVVEDRMAEWLFGAIHVTKTSICLHLGADAFINASPVRRQDGFYFTRSDWDSKREQIVSMGSDFLIAPMIFRGILESEAIHVRRSSRCVNPDSDFSKIEKRLRMIVDPKGYLEKDTCRMSTAALIEMKRCVAVLSVMST